MLMLTIPSCQQVQTLYCSRSSWQLFIGWCFNHGHYPTYTQWAFYFCAFKSWTFDPQYFGINLHCAILRWNNRSKVLEGECTEITTYKEEATGRNNWRNGMKIQIDHPKISWLVIKQKWIQTMNKLKWYEYILFHAKKGPTVRHVDPTVDQLCFYKDYLKLPSQADHTWFSFRLSQTPMYS